MALTFNPIADKVRRTRNLSGDAICTFTMLEDDEDGTRTRRTSVTSVVFSRPEREELQGSAERRVSEAGGVDLGHYVDQVGEQLPPFDNYSMTNFVAWLPQTMMSVSPKIPLEIVMQMFRRMGCVWSRRGLQ
jgi:chloride channel 3/4/5